MQTWLLETWSVKATVLYDKPPTFFKPTTVAEQHELFSRLQGDVRGCDEVRTSFIG